MADFQRELITHPDFYIATWTKNKDSDYLVFIHGGPGFNCGTIEYLIEHENLFQSLNYNLVVYDQRNCGKSQNSSNEITHTNNVHDLDVIYRQLTENNNLNINGFIGHSYGAKLLFDYYKQYGSSLPGIFVSTANSIITPRLNNLTLDLAYLKKTNPIYYQGIITQMDKLDLKTIWELTEKLEPYFLENTDRPYFYWANLTWREKVQNVQNCINLPANKNVLLSVRRELYANETNYNVDIHNLGIPHLWINGFHDYIMNGSEGVVANPQRAVPFYKSSHFPHIEENERFCELVNEFIEHC